MADDLIRMMHALFTPVADRVRDVAWQPPADVYRTREGWLIKFDLAGVRPEDISVSTRGRTLKVTGTRRDLCVGEGCSVYRMEISYSHFERTIELPAQCEGASVSAEYRDGMLLIRIPCEGEKV